MMLASSMPNAMAANAMARGLPFLVALRLGRQPERDGGVATGKFGVSRMLS